MAIGIAEKHMIFIAGDSLETIPKAPQDCPGLPIRQVQRPETFFFEVGARLESPVLNGRNRAFLGAYSYINSGGYIRENVFIGRFCSIGRRVTIAAGGHAISGLSSSPVITGQTATPYDATERDRIGLKPPKPTGPTIILNDVWIGDGAVILPGVTVGSGAVIGANAVVTKDISPYAIVAGTPARTLRYRFSPPWREALLHSRWWDQPLDLINSLPTANILQFLEALKSIPAPERGYETYTLVV